MHRPQVAIKMEGNKKMGKEVESLKLEACGKETTIGLISSDQAITSYNSITDICISMPKTKL